MAAAGLLAQAPAESPAVTCLSLGVLCGQVEAARPLRQPGWHAGMLWLSTFEANRIILTASAVRMMAISIVWTMSRSGIASLGSAVAGAGWLMARRRSVAGSRRRTVVHAAHVFGVKKLLYLGSSCIYPRRCKQPMTETLLLSAPLEPTNEPYAVAKIAGIKLCQAYRRQYGSNFIAAMPTNLTDG